ncbi:hypothetical protein LR010_01355 [Candidatus Gracilibacteria bacterium]|nr:hypothetical protein [Candidatus Gracilibacteria bacterium]
MLAVDTKFYEKKKSSTFYTAVGFLLLVLVLTGGMFFYNTQLDKQNTELETQITQLSTSIESLKLDPNIQTYSIYERHEAFLTKLAKESNIPSFVAHLKKYFAISGIDAKGFNYSQGVVSVSLSSQTNDNGYAYQKVVKFLRDYNNLGEEALFTAQFVPVFEGYDRINFKGEFKLK